MADGSSEDKQGEGVAERLEAFMKQTDDRLTAQENTVSWMYNEYSKQSALMNEKIDGLLSDVQKILTRLEYQKPESEEIEGDTFLVDKNVVEVTGGFFELDALRSYFEGPTSGGYKTKQVIRVTTVKPEVYRVWFESADDAEKVVNFVEKHVVNGQTLKTISFSVYRGKYSLVISDLTKEYQDEDMMTRYLVSTKYGVGRRVIESIEVVSGDSFQVKVTFNLAFGAAALMKRDHFKLGEDVKFTCCPPLDKILGTVKSSESKEETTEKKENELKPFVLQLHPLVSKNLQQNPQVLKDLTESTDDLVSMNDEGAVVFESTPQSEYTCVEGFLFLLSKTISKIDMDTSSEDAVKIVTKRCMQETMTYEIVQGRITVVGLTKPVIDLVCEVQKTCGLESLRIVEECFLSFEDYAFFTEYTRKIIEEDHHCYHVKVLLSDSNKSLSVYGSVQEVQKFKNDLPNLTAHINIPLNMSPPLLFMVRGWKFDHFKSLIPSSGSVIPFFWPPDNPTYDHHTASLLCAESNRPLADQAVTSIKKFYPF